MKEQEKNRNESSSDKLLLRLSGVMEDQKREKICFYLCIIGIVGLTVYIFNLL